MQVKEYAKVFKDIIFNSKGNKDDVFTGRTALKAILGNKLKKNYIFSFRFTWYRSYFYLCRL